MALSPRLQTIFDALMSKHPGGMTLNQLSDDLSTEAVSYGEIDELIGELEAAGIDLEGPEPAEPPEPVAGPEELARVLAAARELTARTGKRPSTDEIARHAGLTAAVVRRALKLGGRGGISSAS